MVAERVTNGDRAGAHHAGTSPRGLRAFWEYDPSDSRDAKEQKLTLFSTPDSQMPVR